MATPLSSELLFTNYYQCIITIVIKKLLEDFELHSRYLHIVCDDDLFHILIDQYKSYQLLAPHLGISETQVHAISSETPHDYTFGKLKLLQLWKKTKGDRATYLNLVWAFLAANDKSCAECVVGHAKRRSQQSNVYPEKVIPVVG